MRSVKLHGFSSILFIVTSLQEIRENPWYERVYKIGVGIKGFDGTVELIAGLWLLIAPNLLHHMLTSWQSGAKSWNNGIGDLLAHGFARLNEELYGGVLVMASIFLISHGIIKLALVYALLKEILWAYPYALGILIVFLIAQIYALIISPGIGMAVLVLLDIFIIVIVYGEWQKLKLEAAAKKQLQ